MEKKVYFVRRKKKTSEMQCVQNNIHISKIKIQSTKKWKYYEQCRIQQKKVKNAQFEAKIIKNEWKN